jgi:hypothetical protein
MGSIELQFNETVEVQRLADVVGTNKKNFSTIIESLSCHIQPLDPSFSQDIPGGFGKEFLMFCETADVREGDRVYRTLNEETLEYRVTGVEKYDFVGHNHMEVTIRIFES